MPPPPQPIKTPKRLLPMVWGQNTCLKCEINGENNKKTGKKHLSGVPHVQTSQTSRTCVYRGPVQEFHNMFARTERPVQGILVFGLYFLRILLLGVVLPDLILGGAPCAVHVLCACCAKSRLSQGPRVLTFAPPMLFWIDHACFCRWMVCRGVPGMKNLIIGAVPALCACCAKSRCFPSPVAMGPRVLTSAPYSPCWYTRDFFLSVMLAMGPRVLSSASLMLF